MRLDLFLVQNRMANSRTQAQDFISKGYVFLKNGNEKIVLKKASYFVDEAIKERVGVEENPLQKFVSRAGLKLDLALQQIDLNITGKIILDIGQSTGGFTDCLIQRGALQVVGIDVGQDQLHMSLKNNSQIKVLEGLNAKDLAKDQKFLKLVPVQKFDMLVMDVSFISITKVITHLPPFLKANGEYLFLVKPQFECGPELLDKNGIVKESEIYLRIEKDIRNSAVQAFGSVTSYFKSEITGKDGNQEYFIYGKNNC